MCQKLLWKKKRYLKCTCSLVPFFNFVCVEKCFDKPIPKIHTFTCFFFNFLCVIKCFKNWYLKYRHSLVHFSILYIKRVLRKPVSELFMFASSILYLFISLVCSFIFFKTTCSPLFWKQQLCHVLLLYIQTMLKAGWKHYVCTTICHMKGQNNIGRGVD